MFSNIHYGRLGEKYRIECLYTKSGAFEGKLSGERAGALPMLQKRM